MVSQLEKVLLAQAVVVEKVDRLLQYNHLRVRKESRGQTVILS
jgi:hypothetical protein